MYCSFAYQLVPHRRLLAAFLTVCVGGFWIVSHFSVGMMNLITHQPTAAKNCVDRRFRNLLKIKLLRLGYIYTPLKNTSTSFGVLMYYPFTVYTTTGDSGFTVQLLINNTYKPSLAQHAF